MNKSVYRILDANYNRTKEALRVIEDIIRFAVSDRALARELKKCRHDLTKSLLDLPMPYPKLVDARESDQDVGKDLVIDDKIKRITFFDLVVANFKRTQESVRVLEETVKIISVKHSDPLRKLRFKIYGLEKKIIRKF